MLYKYCNHNNTLPCYRLRDLTKKDEDKNRLAAVKNNLEAFSYDVKNKLYEEEYEACSTEEEREEIREKITAIMDWYDEQGLDTVVEVRLLLRSYILPASVWVTSLRMAAVGIRQQAEGG